LIASSTQEQTADMLP